MKSIIFISDDSIANRVAEIIAKHNDSMEIVIVDNLVDCVQRSSDSNFAFIGFYDDEIPPQELVSSIVQNGTVTYYIAEEVTEELFDRITNAGGKKVIGLPNLEPEIKTIMKAANRAAGIEVADTQPQKRVDIRSIGTGEETSRIQRVSGGNKRIGLGMSDILKAKKYPGVIISIHGAKGGLGKSTVTANLGVALALLKLKAIAVDLDVENGNLAATLHLSGDKTIKDWIKGNVHEDDDAVVVHESGLKVIPGITQTAESALIDDVATERILGRLARRYDVVIVDTGAIEIDPMLMSMKMADRCYVIGCYDLTRIKNLIKMLNNAKALNIDLGKMKLVMNTVPPMKITEKQDILDNIPLELLAEIKRDDAVLPAVNRGYTPYMDRRCKHLRGGIDKIVEDIISSTEIGKKVNNGGIPKKRGLFGW